MEKQVRFRFRDVPNKLNFRLDGRGMKRLKPGDIVTCHPDKLGSHIKLFDRLDNEDDAKSPNLVLEMVECEGGFNVINGASGEPINNVPLTEKDARAMIEHDFDIEKFKANQKKKNGEVSGA